MGAVDLIVQKVASDRLPSQQSNYILIERSVGGSYHASGHARSAGITKHLDLPLFIDLQVAIDACQPWAAEHGILVIHIHAPAEADAFGAPHVR